MKIKKISLLFFILLNSTLLFAGVGDDNELKLLCKKETLSDSIFNLNNRYKVLNTIDKKIVKSAVNRNNKLIIKFVLDYKKINKINIKKTVKSFSNYCKNYQSSLEFRCLTVYNKIPLVREMIIIYDNNKKKLILDYNSNCKLLDHKLILKKKTK